MTNELRELREEESDENQIFTPCKEATNYERMKEAARARGYVCKCVSNDAFSALMGLRLPASSFACIKRRGSGKKKDETGCR